MSGFGFFFLLFESLCSRVHKMVLMLLHLKTPTVDVLGLFKNVNLVRFIKLCGSESS